MGPSTTKKVLVSRFDRETLAGFVQTRTYLSPQGLELLSTGGTLCVLPYDELKTVCFVRDFQQGEPRKELRLFTSRPKLDGLWVRMRFRDGDLLDGVLANNLLLLEPAGFTVVPPDPGFQNQRLFIPRPALSEIHVLGVIGSPLSTRNRRKPASKEQLDLFGNPVLVQK